MAKPVSILDRADLEHCIRTIGKASDIPAERERIIAAAQRLHLVEVLPEGWRPGVNKGISFQKAFDVEPSSGVAPAGWDLLKASALDLLDGAARELAKSSGRSYESCYAKLMLECPKTATAAVR